MGDPETCLIDQERDEEETKGAMPNRAKETRTGNRRGALWCTRRRNPHGDRVGGVKSGVTGVGAQTFFGVGLDQG